MEGLNYLEKLKALRLFSVYERMLRTDHSIYQSMENLPADVDVGLD